MKKLLVAFTSVLLMCGIACAEEETPEDMLVVNLMMYVASDFCVKHSLIVDPDVPEHFKSEAQKIASDNGFSNEVKDNAWKKANENALSNMYPLIVSDPAATYRYCQKMLPLFQAFMGSTEKLPF